MRRALKTHPRVRGGYAVRASSLVFGLFLFALAVVLILESKLGLSPWDVLNQGIAKHTPLSFGMANVAVGIVILGVGWSLGGRPGVGTVANAVLVGTFIQGLTSIAAIEGLAHDGLPARIAMLVLGIALIGPGSAFYIGADLGAGPRDTLMLVGARRTRFRIGVVRATLELIALAAGIALGGTFGVGTVLFAFLVGPIVEASFARPRAHPLGQAVARRRSRSSSPNEFACFQPSGSGVDSGASRGRRVNEAGGQMAISSVEGLAGAVKGRVVRARRLGLRRSPRPLQRDDRQASGGGRVLHRRGRRLGRHPVRARRAACGSRFAAGATTAPVSAASTTGSSSTCRR